MNDRFPDTVSFDEQHCALIIIDQTLLPGELKLLSVTDVGALFEAIASLRVRGAPAIGVAAAIGLYVCASRFEEREPSSFAERVRQTAAVIASCRPTAVNLRWALERVCKRLDGLSGVEEMLAAMKAEALAIREQDISVCRRIGEAGLSLLHDGDGILTHCNAGRLAAVRYGTALAPVYLAAERGLRLRLFADETRPLLQGARLTVSELSASSIDTTLLCDNMAASLMQSGQVQAVFVGCDRVAANGDTANKIGTLGVAMLAQQFGIPFYVCAPCSTIDMACPGGANIPVEQRAADEVTGMWYRAPMAADGVKVYNPAFDVTPHCFITAFVTEYGVIPPPFDRRFSALFAQEVTL